MDKEGKPSYEDFFKTAVLKLRNTSKSRGIHSVFSGFNQAFREYYDEDPIKVTQKLVSDGKIETRPVKRGVMIYLPGDAPKSRSSLGKEALSKILNGPLEKDEVEVENVSHTSMTSLQDITGAPYLTWDRKPLSDPQEATQSEITAGLIDIVRAEGPMGSSAVKCGHRIHV